MSAAASTVRLESRLRHDRFIAIMRLRVND